MQSNFIGHVMDNLKLLWSPDFFKFLPFFRCSKFEDIKTLSGILFLFILLKSPSKVMHACKVLDPGKKFFLVFVPTYCGPVEFSNQVQPTKTS